MAAPVTLNELQNDSDILNHALEPGNTEFDRASNSDKDSALKLENYEWYAPPLYPPFRSIYQTFI